LHFPTATPSPFQNYNFYFYNNPTCRKWYANYSLQQQKQELNSLETSCDWVGGLIEGVVKIVSFSMVERGLVKKVSFGSLERTVVKKSVSAWLDCAKKKSPKSCQKVVKKCQKVIKNFLKPDKFFF
jgi:hypothetical protein